MPAARPIAVKLDPSIHARMQKLAKVQDRSTHYLMRKAIAQYVDREERREALRQDALRAWNTYQLTGQHVTHAEAGAF
jgi:predicted transcriptional regulator